MKKKYAHIDLPPDLQAFRDRFIAATEIEATMCGITFYKVHGRYFARTKSSLTGKRVKKDKRFRRTMQHAAVMALAVKYVTPIYNELTDDWRCQDLYHRLIGMGMKLLHQGNTKEVVQQAMYAELERLGYRTEWPVWQLPPSLEKWKEGEEPARKDSFGVAWRATPGVGGAALVREGFLGESGFGATSVDNEMPIRRWTVNEQGKLELGGLIAKHHDCAVAMPP